MAAGHRPKLRAHRNPLSEPVYGYPLRPDETDWSKHFPDFYREGNKHEPRVAFADVGCGFGGLLVNLSPLFPSKLILGLEIRDAVVERVEDRIEKLRNGQQPSVPHAPTQKRARTGDSAAPPQGWSYSNISVVQTNIMKHCPNYFQRGQLEKMFFCFPDPHFKRSNFRRRVIGPRLLDLYAYALSVGGLAYTITDVRDLHDWMVKHFSEHPLFSRVPNEELSDDPCIRAMEETDEGKKVTRKGGQKYIAVFRRVAAAEAS